MELSRGFEIEVSGRSRIHIEQHPRRHERALELRCRSLGFRNKLSEWQGGSVAHNEHLPRALNAWMVFLGHVARAKYTPTRADG